MQKINFINNSQPAINDTNLNKLQDNVEDAIDEVQDDVTSKLDKTSVKDTYSTSATDTYSCNYVNSLETYSTTETRIGTWIDNKPIYRKVVARNLSITNGTNIDLSSLNINELIKIKSINTDSNRYTFFDEYYDNSTSKINLHYRDGLIEAWTGSGVYYTSTVWIEYTKITD